MNAVAGRIHWPEGPWAREESGQAGKAGRFWPGPADAVASSSNFSSSNFAASRRGSKHRAAAAEAAATSVVPEAFANEAHRLTDVLLAAERFRGGVEGGG